MSRVHVSLRLDPKDARTAEQAAAAAGLSVSEYIRQALRERVQMDAVAAAYRAELSEALRAEIERAETRQAADLGSIAKALGEQVPKAYFVAVTRHLSQQLGALLQHHRIALPPETST